MMGREVSGEWWLETSAVQELIRSTSIAEWAFCFTFWRQSLRKLGLTLCFLSASQFCQRHNLPGENDWNPQWGKKKMKKNEFITWARTWSLSFKGNEMSVRGDERQDSYQTAVFCFVFFSTRIWFREEMWPLQTNINHASISFKYINTKIKGKHLRVEKNCITCHRGLFPFHL